LQDARETFGADAAAQARKATGNRTGVITSDGTQLPFADGTFEAITSFETIAHLHDRAALFEFVRPRLWCCDRRFGRYSSPVAHFEVRSTAGASRASPESDAFQASTRIGPLTYARYTVGTLRRYIPELDGLRAFAILPVKAAHFGHFSHVPSVFRFGGTGVDLFFVLSGYLITGILLTSKAKKGYYRNFFARRGLRIWPLYIAVLVAAAGLSRASRPIGFQVNSWWPYVFYVSNLTLLDFPPWPLAVTWSLCIEEQFYLIWPMLVSLASRSIFKYILVGIIIGEPMLRYLLTVYGVPEMMIYRGTPTRLDGLAIGALIAAMLQYGPLNLRRFALLAAGLALLLFAGLRFTSFPVRIATSYSVISTGCGAVLLLALDANRTGGWLSKLLSLRLLTSIGKISYGLYILHYPIYYLVSRLGRFGDQANGDATGRNICLGGVVLA
jgi:peptidoglycan/LPS O-acetylase OafA/YrhL